MNDSTYSTSAAAQDAGEYAAACALLKIDPDDLDAQSTIDDLNARYGEGFFED